VEEVTFINQLNSEERKASLQQRLEDGAGGRGLSGQGCARAACCADCASGPDLAILPRAMTLMAATNASNTKPTQTKPTPNQTATGEQRRAEQRAALMARQQEVSASVREAQERRRAMEHERLAQLASKQRRKQALQERMEEERRAVAQAREANKGQHLALAAQRRATRQAAAAEMAVRINERLGEAAQRR